MSAGHDRRAATYAAWQAAAVALDRRTTIENSGAEQAAWEAYTEVCGDLDECIEPGCFTITREHVYCPAHRPR